MESPLCTEIPSNCRLIETFRFDPKAGAVHISLHLSGWSIVLRHLDFHFATKLR